jgi:hypothetical protein
MLLRLKVALAGASRTGGWGGRGGGSGAPRGGRGSNSVVRGAKNKGYDCLCLCECVSECVCVFVVRGSIGCRPVFVRTR